MTFLAKPRLHHPTLPKNKLGFTRRDYEGKVSTLCAGCGHDSISAALIEAFFELDIQPHRVAKLSGIGCSSKTTAYFVAGAHGFNAVHGRMPSIATGANAANRRLRYAFTGIANARGGPTSGPRGNLRDSDATPSRNGYALYNWCIHFDEAVP